MNNFKIVSLRHKDIEGFLYFFVSLALIIQKNDST